MKKMKKIQLISLSFLVFLIFAGILVENSNFNSSNNQIIESEQKTENIQSEDKNSIENFNSIPKISNKEWWDGNWLHRVPIEIQSNNLELTNYQTNININLTSWIEDEFMNEDGEDIRFVDSFNNELSYWLEEINVVSKNSSIWVKVPQISTTESETIIYMYIGNPDVSTTSNAENTFVDVLEENEATWLFDEGSGNVAGDSSGNDYNGTLVNGPTYVDGVFGDALDFDGANQYVNIPDDGLGTSITSMSIALWAKGISGPSANGGWSYIMHRGSANIIGSSVYWIGVNSSGNYAACINGRYSQGATDVNANHDDWRFIVLTYDGSAMKVYIDGVLKVEDPFGSIGNSQTNNLIGLGSTPHDPTYRAFNGSIDDVRVFDRTLTYGEINNLFENRGYSTFNKNFTTLVRKNTLTEPTISIGALISADLQITCVDVDGFIVPNAMISITNDSQPEYNQYGISDEAGNYMFSNVYPGKYNITVNYTQHNIVDAETTIVFHEEKDLGGELLDEIVLTLDLWSINFNISTYDFEGIDNGYVLLSNNSDIVGNASLVDGKASIRWLNQTEYNYSVYFDYTTLTDGSDYALQQILIDNGTINRAITSYSIEDLDIGIDGYIAGAGNYVDFDKKITPNEGNYFGEFNITLENINEYIVQFTVNAKIAGVNIPIYHYINGGENLNDISIINNTKVEEINIYLRKNNPEAVNGTLSFWGNESTDVNRITNFSSTVFNVTDQDGAPLQNIILRIYNETSTPTTDNIVASLITDSSGFATFRGLNNNTQDWGNYTVLTWFAGNLWNFRYSGDVNEKDKGLNFTFEEKLILELEILLNIGDFQTNFNSISQSPTDYSNDIYWGDEVSFKFNFTSVDETSSELEVPSQIQLQFRYGGEFFGPAIDLLEYMGGDGIFNYTFNTSEIGFIGGLQYSFTISATKTGYTNAEPLDIYFNVNALPTEVIMHDYEDTNEIIGDDISEYFGEARNITVSYRNTKDNSLITGAFLSYSLGDWDSGSNIEEDPLNPGYYTFLMNTSKAFETGTFTIQITMQLQNYTTSTYGKLLYVVPRLTSIKEDGYDSTSQILQISKTINETDSEMFYFEYFDETNSEGNNGDIISEYDFATYTWQKLGGDFGSGVLTNTTDSENRYVLDFETASQDIGTYVIIVSIGKENYEQRQAIVILTIEKRLFAYDFKGDIGETSIRILRGDNWNISVQLNDASRGFIPLTTAELKFNVPSISYSETLTHVGGGLYSLIASWNDIKDIFVEGSYNSFISINNNTFVPVNQQLTLLLPNRTARINYQGDLSDDLQITKVKSNDVVFTYRMRLTDAETGNPIENAAITLNFRSIGVFLTLVHIGDGIYEATESFENVDAFTTDISFQGQLVIEIENYDTIRYNLATGFKMEEIFEGVPMFYFLLVVGAAVLLVGSIAGYRMYQQAKIPGFVKLITATEKQIKSKKDVKPESLTVSAEDEIIERYGEHWKALDLNLTTILKGDAEQADSLTPGDIGGNE